MDEDLLRRRVITEAYSWLDTPHVHNQRAKGAGVDCANFPAAVYAAAGLIPPQAVEAYPAQWHLHRQDGQQPEERYLNRVLTYAREFDGPLLPGDFVLWKFGHCWAHGAIVIKWPIVIHAAARQGVVLGNAERDSMDKHLLKDRAPRFFTVFGTA